MAAEAEIQQYFEKAGALAAAGYHAAMRDGTIPAMGREAIKDVRNTIHEIFFGRSEHGGEPGAPLNPLFQDNLQARASHEAAPESPAAALPPSPADLSEGPGPAAPPHADTPQVSPAAPELPADVLADVKAAGAAVRDNVRNSAAEVGREELGRLPAQDPPQVSPADLAPRPQQSAQGVSPAGPDAPAELVPRAEAAAATAKASIQQSPAEVGREELGQLPTQDPPRQRPKL